MPGLLVGRFKAGTSDRGRPCQCTGLARRRHRPTQPYAIDAAAVADGGWMGLARNRCPTPNIKQTDRNYLAATSRVVCCSGLEAGPASVPSRPNGCVRRCCAAASTCSCERVALLSGVSCGCDTPLPNVYFAKDGEEKCFHGGGLLLIPGLVHTKPKTNVGSLGRDTPACWCPANMRCRRCLNSCLSTAASSCMRWMDFACNFFSGSVCFGCLLLQTHVVCRVPPGRHQETTV